jgi:hypothetical protein
MQNQKQMRRRLGATLLTLKPSDKDFAKVAKTFNDETRIMIRLAGILRFTRRSNHEPRDAREERGPQSSWPFPTIIAHKSFS